MIPPTPAPWTHALEDYTPGEQPHGEGVIKLNTNEFPYPPAPAVLEAIKREASASIRRYPSSRCDRLREKLGERFGVDADHVFVGNGSDEVLRLLIGAFGGQGRMVASLEPTYSLYGTLAQLAGGSLKSYAMQGDLEEIPQAAFVEAWDLMLLCQPNPPLGTFFDDDKINTLSESEGLLVIDQAYVEFCGDEKYISFSYPQDNIVLTRTFSKTYGLAGLRVGYAVGSPSVIGVLDRVADSYNVNRVAQAAAEAALDSEGYYREKVAEIVKNRKWLAGELSDRGFRVPRSHANFVFAWHPEAEKFYATLREAGILVRHFDRPLLRAGIRISIGTREELESVLRVLDEA